MKRAVIAFLIFSSFVSCSNMPTSIKGIWYGMKDGSPVRIEFADSTLTFASEAQSASNFTSPYSMTCTGDTLLIDFTITGMPCQSIARVNEKGNLDLIGQLVIQPGMTRPSSFEEVPSSPLVLAYIDFSRDPSSAQMERKNPPANAIKAFERNQRLGHGINLNATVDGNQCLPDSPIDAPLTAAEVKAIADSGFKSVRIPTTWVKHCLGEAPYTIEPEFFNKMDGIIDECLKNGLAVSVDMHYYPYINMSEPDPELSWEQNIDRFKSLWKQISEHFSSYPSELYFDLLNEPNMAISATDYNALMKETIGIVRKTNPDRTILIGTPLLGQHWTLGLLDLPEDDWNIIVQVHYYLPHTFTHQGLSYAMASGTEGAVWTGTAEEKSPIVKDFDFIFKWSELNGRPINVGEFGVVDYADEASRVAYLGYLRELMDKNGISFHLWGFREYFGIFDAQSIDWDEPIVDALNR